MTAPDHAASVSMPSGKWGWTGNGRVAWTFRACSYLVALAALLILVGVTLRNNTAQDWVTHTVETRQTVGALSDPLLEAESAARAYVITHDGTMLAQYEAARAAIAAPLARLRALTADNAIQSRRLDVLAPLIAERLHVLAATIGEVAPDTAGRSADPLPLGTGMALMARIRAELRAFDQQENILLAQRHDAATAARRWLLVALAALFVLTLCLFSLDSWVAQRRAQALRTANRRLDQTVQEQVGSLHDSEARLRRSEAQLRLLITAAPAAIAMFDRNMRYLAFSDRFREDYRLGNQPLLGRSHYELFPEIPEAWRATHRRCLAGRAERNDEDRFERPDGSVEWVRWEILPWHDEHQLIGGIILFSEVITARKRAEQSLVLSDARLRQAQKMEVVGQLTGGIAHDFNNILGVVMGNIEFLRDSVASDAAKVALAQAILDAAGSGAELTRRLLAFARKQPLQPQSIDLRQYIPSLVSLIRRTIGEAIHVSVTMADDLWLVEADQGQVGESLLNLAINARDAMPKGGDLAIGVTNAILDEQYAGQNAEVSPGDYVVLSVTDTGCGMPPEVLERAIEPFFTTKEVGEGTGLGLSMIYGFAKQSGGHLKIYSEVGFGTTVRLYLPRMLAEPDAESGAASAQRDLPRGSETILLVDDNPQMRAVARRHLETLGYAVTTAETGPAALVILQSGRAFDLLLTDVVMPDGMSGYDLAEAATQFRSEQKVLFTTGYAEGQSSNGHHGGRQNGYKVLRKPYRRKELADLVRAVLSTSP